MLVCARMQHFELYVYHETSAHGTVRRTGSSGLDSASSMHPHPGTTVVGHIKVLKMGAPGVFKSVYLG